MSRVQNAMNAPVVCPHCGSRWFREATFNQYSQGLYSSVPGGELATVSNMPQTLRICLCGQPLNPNVWIPAPRASADFNSLQEHSLSCGKRLGRFSRAAGQEPACKNRWTWSGPVLDETTRDLQTITWWNSLPNGRRLGA
jgi:hypothetical protein